MRVGFLFNHYAEHQVLHAAPYAFELSRQSPEIDVILACSTAAEMRMARAIATLYPGHRCSFQRLHLSWRKRLISPFKDPWKFQRKKKILSCNLDFFRSLDALVTPERTSLRLRKKRGLKDLTLVHTLHGAGDAPTAFDDRSDRFDFNLLPGQKHVDRLKALGFLRDNNYAVAGLPKFEAVLGLQQSPKRFFENDKPVVVYNPHFKRHLSSWHSLGLEILEFFAGTNDYNLIFAPHILLFRKKEHDRDVLRPYRCQSNILIDTDSTALADMTYTLAADIYLGDVSSQIYEFLLRPRPCVFVNAHQVDWEHDESYAQWRFGAVIKDIKTSLGAELKRANDRHSEFVEEQKAAFRYTFRIEEDSTAAERGADAIANFLDRLDHGSCRQTDAAARQQVQDLLLKSNE